MVTYITNSRTTWGRDDNTGFLGLHHTHRIIHELPFNTNFYETSSRNVI